MPERRKLPDRRRLLYRLGGRRATDPKPDHRPIPLEAPLTDTVTELPAWLSVSAYARTYGLTRNTVYKLLEHQLLQVYTLTGTVDVIRIRNRAPNDPSHLHHSDSE